LRLGRAKLSPPLCLQAQLVIFRKSIAGVSEPSLARFLTRARRAARLRGQVNVLVTGSREMRALNRRFRHKDMPTDVLSFLAPEAAPKGFSGDIAVCADIARQNARRLGHSAAEELKVLVLHGVLHLAGYDHEQDEGRMFRKEQRLRRELRLPQSLTERSAGAKAPASLGQRTARLKAAPLRNKAAGRGRRS
jgi:probable rRNA maturation factor